MRPGSGLFVFCRRGLEVTALDHVRAESEAFSQAGIEFVEQDLRRINFSKNSFAVVYAHLSLHFFDDKTTKLIFKKIYKILKPGGLFFVKCKSTDDALFGKGRRIEENVYFKDFIRHYFSKEYMRENLRDFKIISLRKTSSFYRFYKASFIEAVATKLQ